MMHNNQPNSLSQPHEHNDLMGVLEIPTSEYKFINSVTNKNENDEITGFNITVASTKFAHTCPYCKSQSLTVHANTTKNFRATLICDRPVLVTVNLRRYKCHSCGRTHTEECSFQHNNCRITTGLAKSIINNCNIRGLNTFKQNAQINRVSEYYAKRVFLDGCNASFRSGKSGDHCFSDDNMPICTYDRPNYVVTKLLIDEFATVGRNYVTVFLDGDTHELLYWCCKNTKATIRNFLSWIGDKISPCCNIACDMNAPYLSAFQQYLPDSNITFDRFHFISNTIDDLSSACKIIARSLPDEQQDIKDLFKGSNCQGCRLICTREENISSNKDKKTLNKILSAAPEFKGIRAAYLDIIESFDDAVKAKVNDNLLLKQPLAIACENIMLIDSSSKIFAPYKVRTALYNNVGGPLFMSYQKPSLQSALDKAQSDDEKEHILKKSERFSPLTRACQRILSKLPHIASFADSKLTTGPVEGLNNLIKSIKHTQFGIKNLSIFMDKIRVCSKRAYVSRVHTDKGYRL